MPSCVPLVKYWEASRARQRYANFQKDPLVVAAYVEDVADAVRNPALLQWDIKFAGACASTLHERYLGVWKGIKSEVGSQQPEKGVGFQEPSRLLLAATKKCRICNEEVAAL